MDKFRSLMDIFQKPVRSHRILNVCCSRNKHESYPQNSTGAASTAQHCAFHMLVSQTYHKDITGQEDAFLKISLRLVQHPSCFDRQLFPNW